MDTSGAMQEPTSTRTFDSEFKDRYSSSKYNYEGAGMVNKTVTDPGKKDDLKSKPSKIESSEISRNLVISLGPWSWLLYVTLFGSICYLLYILYNGEGSGLFSSNRHKKLDDFENINSENIGNADINILISNAETNKEFRLAIRYYNILALKTLALKNHIRFEDDKTNADYLNDIKSKPIASAFERTSYLYNYIWYGKFPLDIQQYTKARDKFLSLLNQVNS